MKNLRIKGFLNGKTMINELRDLTYVTYILHGYALDEVHIQTELKSIKDIEKLQKMLESLKFCMEYGENRKKYEGVVVKLSDKERDDILKMIQEANYGKEI